MRCNCPPDLDIENINLDCPKVWELFAEANTTGVFQLENFFTKKLCKTMKPSSIEDLAALSTILRPGTLEALDEEGKSLTWKYIDRKIGKEPIEQPIKALEPILKDTYQLAIYQENAIQIANEIAGFSLEESDSLRKAIGKKDPELMRELKQKFIDGCIKTGKVTEEEAKIIFDGIEKSQRYSFNKCISGSTKIGWLGISNDSIINNNIATIYWDGIKDLGHTLSMAENGCIRKNEIIAIRYEGFQETLEVILKSGKSIRATTNHKFPTTNGNKPLSEISVGDFLFSWKGLGHEFEKDEIISITKYGFEDVYDVEMGAPEHNFLIDNGIVTCNSHAVGYSVISYWTAYCKAHFPLQFYCSYLNHSKDRPKPHEEIKKLIYDAYKNDIKVEPPLLEKLNSKFIIEDDTIYYGLCYIKDVGETCIKELIEINKQSPIKGMSWCEILFKVLLNINKSCARAFILCGTLRKISPINREKILYEYNQVQILTNKEIAWIQNSEIIKGENSLKNLLTQVVRLGSGKGKPLANKNRVKAIIDIISSLNSPNYNIEDTVANLIKYEQMGLGLPITLGPGHNINLNNAVSCLELAKNQSEDYKKYNIAARVDSFKEYVNDKGKIGYLCLIDETAELRGVKCYTKNWEQYGHLISQNRDFVFEVRANTNNIIINKVYPVELFSVDKDT